MTDNQLAEELVDCLIHFYHVKHVEGSLIQINTGNQVFELDLYEVDSGAWDDL